MSAVMRTLRFYLHGYGLRMEFTALHRLLGRDPGPLTDDMISEAVSQGVCETDDLD